MTTLNLLFIILGTIFFIIFSWFLSLKEKRYHGIPRFFAFEGLLILFPMQWPVWFVDPFSPNQIASWFLLGLSLFLAINAFYLFYRYGKYHRNFERTTQLISNGLYHYIRHPMYGSLACLGWGFFFKSITWQSIILVAVITVSLFITCKVEERELIAKFGEAYREYMKKTKMWIPWVI